MSGLGHAEGVVVTRHTIAGQTRAAGHIPPGRDKTHRNMGLSGVGLPRPTPTVHPRGGQASHLTAPTRRTRTYTTHKMFAAMRRICIIFGLCTLMTVPVVASGFRPGPTPIQSGFAALASYSAPTRPVIGSPVSLAQQDRDDWGLTKQDANRKSVSRAMLYSALLPGLGEHYVGSRKKARYFFAVEAISWLGFLSYHTYGNWREDDYINFARERAGAQLEDKDDLHRDWVGFYDDIDQFNEFGRVQDRERPYLVDNESNHWRWRSASDKSAYRELKNRSREAFRRRDFTVGLMILNRIVSIIDAIHDARKTRRLFGDTTPSNGRERFGYRLDIDPLSAGQQVRLELLARF